MLTRTLKFKQYHAILGSTFNSQRVYVQHTHTTESKGGENDAGACRQHPKLPNQHRVRQALEAEHPQSLEQTTRKTPCTSGTKGMGSSAIGVLS